MITHLCFHGLGTCETEREPGEARYWVAEEVFLRILDAVAARTDVALSFDDGNASDAEVALPALRTRGLDATFFALAGRLDDPASLGPGDLKELRRAGMTIGSHGWHHVSWRSLHPRDEHRELVEARSALAEASGGEVSTAAMPLGQYDRRVLASLRREGYDTVFSSDRFPARRSAWLQARYSVTARDTVGSVLGLVDAGPRPREVRNAVACAVKRLR